MMSVGIDVAEETKGLDLVALDEAGCVICSCGRLSVAAAAALVLGELRPDVVCIDSPSGWARQGRSRAAERELSRLGYRCFYTGPDPGDHPFYRWARVGMNLFAGVSPAYPLYRGGPVAGRAAEVFPNATARIVSGRPPRPGETKLRFRRCALEVAGVAQDDLANLDRVDAALAALTGLYGLTGRSLALGDPAEGMVLIPRPGPLSQSLSR